MILLFITKAKQPLSRQRSGSRFPMIVSPPFNLMFAQIVTTTTIKSWLHWIAAFRRVPGHLIEDDYTDKLSLTNCPWQSSTLSLARSNKHRRFAVVKFVSTPPSLHSCLSLPLYRKDRGILHHGYHHHINPLST